MKRFDKVAFGYRVDDVDSYLKEAAAEVASLQAENADLQSKLRILAEKLEEYRQDETSMKEALVGAQKLGNSMLSEARAKADTLVSEAEAKANQTVLEAETKADRIISDATDSSQKTLAAVKSQIEQEQYTLLLTQREVSAFKSKLLALYKSHLDTITSIPEIKKEDLPEEAPVEEPEEKAAEEAAVEAPVEEITEAPAEEAPASEQAEAPKFEASPFYPGRRNSEGYTSMESKFGDLRFGRNANK